MKCELLAPAGNPEKLRLALRFGADAVYLGGKDLSLRTYAGNFTEKELREGLAYAHVRGKRVYVAVNVFARNADLKNIAHYLGFLAEIGADGVLVSDMGALRIARRSAPRLPVHISTQANTTNAEAVKFFAEQGAVRVVLARELSLSEIAEIHAACPETELEAFVHGAMCLSYSGRCYLSDYLDGRSANRGACAQPCRYEYEVRAKGKEGWMPLEEDGRGTYLLNSRDLNMSAHLFELQEAGVTSFKIEGRMKSESYLATVVNAYRRLIDGSAPREQLYGELQTIVHRAYTTAYALSDREETMSRDGSQISGSCDFVAIVRGCSGGRIEVEMRNRFREGDLLEVLSPDASFGKSFPVCGLRGENGEGTSDAKLVQGKYTLDCPYPLSEGDILRRRR